MKIIIDYFVKRISDNKIMEIRHLTLTEYDILKLARTKAKMPLSLDNEEYELTDFVIGEIKGLK